MTDKKTIFSVGNITYDEEWYHQNGLKVKPIHYNQSFLKEIASNTMGSSLELTHGNKTIDVIGHINDLEFIEDNLVANVTTNEELNGMGFSPEFVASFRDKGAYYEAFDGKLLKTILTDSPRCYTTFNGNVDGGSNMNEELIDTLNKQIKDLNKQNAVLETKLKANEEKVKEFDSLQAEINRLTEENNSYKTQIDGLKPKADAYSKIEADMKADLLTKAFGEDEEAKKAWESASMEQLESLAKHRETTRQATGIGANNAEGIDEGDGEGEEEPNKAEEALAFYKKLHNGEEPSFLKQEGGQ